MANLHKAQFLESLRTRFGNLRKLAGSQSLFEIGDGDALIYVRYSKVHTAGRTFFGLRSGDLRRLVGQNSYLCFLLDDGSQPVFVPYADFEEVFHNATPADDGQYKVQLYTQHGALELYVARQGRFNVEGNVGFDVLARGLHAAPSYDTSQLSHSDVQTLLAGIGHAKGYDVWIPSKNVNTLNWSLTPSFELRPEIPEGFESIKAILSEIDVVWVQDGRSTIEGLFEVEHSTPIYSGLLRFNDVLLTNPSVSRYSIVSNDARRSVFSRQAFRPTFRKSGLAELVSFLEYPNVFNWHARIVNREKR